jgi:hypothetical protein
LLLGDVVAFQLPNWREAVLNLACALAGLGQPIVPIYRDAELRVMLGDCGARALFPPTLFRKVDYAAMARSVGGSSRADPCVHRSRKARTISPRSWRPGAPCPMRAWRSIRWA